MNPEKPDPKPAAGQNKTRIPLKKGIRVFEHSETTPFRNTVLLSGPGSIPGFHIDDLIPLIQLDFRNNHIEIPVSVDFFLIRQVAPEYQLAAFEFFLSAEMGIDIPLIQIRDLHERIHHVGFLAQQGPEV